MEFNKRKTVNDKLSKYCCFSDKDDFIEVTEWTNQEGYDINISNKNDTKSISLSHGEIEAIYYLVKTLDFQE